MPDGSCPTCGARAPAAARFCADCGASLSRRCAECGSRSTAGASFCAECGAPLPRLGAGAEERTAPERTAGDQRRTVSILFADLVGYTSMAERLDHENVKTLTDRCLSRLAVEVERYGGRVDQFIGDNVMAVFGAPVAHEDDAERAVRAAWAMQATMTELNRELTPEFGVDLALRVGVNTGEVLAGRIGGSEYTVVGDAVNVASRLQTAAPVGGILVGERTWRGSSDAIVYREVGPLMLKGKTAPVKAWEATALRALAPAEEQPEPSTPFVDRTAERAQLKSLLMRAADERASHLVSVIGEPGVGKTRLVAELEGSLAEFAPSATLLRGRCPAFGSGLIYWPLAEMLRGLCGIAAGDTAEVASAKFDERIGALLAGREGAAGIKERLAPLSRLIGAEHAPPQDAPAAEEGREGFFGAVRAVFEAVAAQSLLVLVWEDLHSADEESLDLVDYLAQWLRAPVVQVCLARETLLERRSAWGSMRPGTTGILLEPLAPSEASQLISQVAASRGASIQAPAMLAQRSGGNPLFAEALVDRIAEEPGAAEAAELPDTVQSLLAARLDALPNAERRLLDHAAVVGHEFSAGSLEPIVAGQDSDLTAQLMALRRKNLIVLAQARASERETEFAFKHVLIRDVAYGMLSKGTRARKHAEVGAFLERRASAKGDDVAAVLAEHMARAAVLAAEAHLEQSEVAGLRIRALACGEAAGDAAASMFANEAALDHYRAAAAFAGVDDETAIRLADKSADIDLRLGHLDAAVAAWERCLAFHTERGDVARAAQVHGKIARAFTEKGERDSAIRHLQRGIDAIKDEPPAPALARLYQEAAVLHMQRGDNMWAVYASEQAVRLAEKLGEPRLAARAHEVYGRVFGRIGDSRKARESLERAIAVTRDSHSADAIQALLAMGRNLEDCDGDYDGANQHYAEALELASHVGDVPAQIELRSALAQLSLYRCEWEQAALSSDISATLAEREGLVGRLCLPAMVNGQLRWREGEWDASERLFADASDIALDSGRPEVSIRALIGLAATLRDRGDVDGAESTLMAAIAAAERAGSRPHAVQAFSAMALVRALAGRQEEARQAATRALALGRLLKDPANEAAALEASGIVGKLSDGLEALARARETWARLGRALDSARCLMLIGTRMGEQDPGAAGNTLARAAAMFDDLGVAHLAERARTLEQGGAGPMTR